MQLSPCVKLFIELLLEGSSAVTSKEVAMVCQPQDVVTHCRTGLPPNAPIPEKVGDAKRDRVCCATALLEEPARLKPAANR